MNIRLLSSTSLAVPLLLCGPAFAQTAPAPADHPAQATPPADAPATETQTNAKDIIVTAQRREERLFDVPVTVNVVSGDQIDKQNMASIRDVLEHSPQVSYQQTGDDRTDTLSIRGISSVSNAAGVEPDVAIFIDGEALSRTMQMNYDAVDVDRVEILEGPQGTLFGKNAVAGLINIVTKKPRLDTVLSGQAKLDIAEDNEYRLKASVNIPLTDRSALYLTGYGSYSGGWEDNVHPGEPNGGQSKSAGARAQYLFQPDPTLSFVLKGEYTYKRTGIIPYAFKELSEDDVIKASQSLSGGLSMVDQFNALLSASGINLISDGGVSTPIINGTQSYLYDDRTWGKTHSYAFSLTGTKDLGHATLHYLGTYRYYKLYSNDNEWGVSAPQLTNSELGLNLFNYAGPSTEKTMQQELRIESGGSGPFNYVAGAFYYYNDNYHHEVNKTCNDAVYGYYNGSGYPDPNPINPVDNFQCTGGYHGRYNVTDFETRIVTHNEAFYGDVEFNAWKGLTLFGGARLLWEQQHMMLHHFEDDDGAKHFFDPNDPFQVLKEHDSHNALTHRVGLKYNFGPVMIYGSESTSFKGVSWDNYGQASLARASQALPPERPQQFEVGMRGELFRGRLDWQVSAFHLKDDHFQARTNIRDPGFQIAVVDAGTAVSKGIEAGANATLARGLRIGGGYTWLPKATLVDDVLFPNRDQFVDYKGARLPNAPKHAYKAYVSYDFDFPESMASNLRFDLRYRGMQQSVLTLDELQRVDPYTIVDGTYTLSPKDGKWSLTFYVKNLFNHLYYQRAYEPAVLGWSFGQMAYLPRDYKRYVGANVIYKF